MPVAVKCPSCGRTSAVREDSVGRKVACPHCHSAFQAQAIAPVPAVRPTKPPQVVEPLPIGRPAQPPAPVREEKACAFCGELVLVAAKKCKHCGEALDVALRAAEEAKRSNSAAPPIVIHNTASAAAAATAVAKSRGGISALGCLMIAALLGVLGLCIMPAGKRVADAEKRVPAVEATPAPK